MISRDRQPSRSRLASYGVGLLVLTGLLGCAGGGSSDAAADRNTVTSAAETPAAATPAAATAIPTPNAASSPTGGPTLIPTPTPTDNSTPAPLPVAEIVTPGATIVGTLGTYTIDGRGTDAPWLPFNSLPSITSRVGEVLTIRFSDGATIGDLAAVIASADDASGSTTYSVDGTLPPAGGATASVGPLPAGRWVLQVRLFRADGRGEGLTYWAVTVR